MEANQAAMFLEGLQAYVEAMAFLLAAEADNIERDRNGKALARSGDMILEQVEPHLVAMRAASNQLLLSYRS